MNCYELYEQRGTRAVRLTGWVIERIGQQAKRRWRTVDGWGAALKYCRRARGRLVERIVSSN